MNDTLTKRTRSEALFEKARQHIPGGVNSPVRAFKSVGGSPLFIKRAKGAYLFDEDNNRYIDYINSWGPTILGHAQAEVVEALQKQAAEGTSFGAPTELEVQMAMLIKKMVPGVDLVRMVNSGTEACMSALRLARGFTGRNKVIKFEGCYHGHADSFLVKAGSGVATLGIQTVPGVPASVANGTITAAFNNLEEVEKLVQRHGTDVAAIILEPVAGNMGCIPPVPGFLQGLRALCDQHNIVLIFDEVMTGFRLAAGGAQELFNVRADLVTFGKIIGGGLPVGAFAGRKEIMEHIAPVGQVYQAGTLSGNPLAMAAGLAMLNALHAHSSLYQELNAKCRQLGDGFAALLSQKGVDFRINRVGSMMSIHFGHHDVTDFDTAKACNNSLFNRFFHHMLHRGVYLPPSAFESWFICTALSENDIAYTLQAANDFPFN